MLLEFDQASAGPVPLPSFCSDPPRVVVRPCIAAAHTANPPLAVLSETLRAPLMPIIGFAQLIQADLPERHRAHHYAVEIETAAMGLLAVLDALLARANGRPMPADAEPEVADAAEDALGALRTLLEYSRLRR